MNATERRGGQPKPLADSLRGAFEAVASGTALPESIRRDLLRDFDNGRDDQIETWAEQLDGDPTGEQGRGTGHARCLAPDVRKAIAESRSIRDTSKRRQAA